MDLPMESSGLPFCPQVPMIPRTMTALLPALLLGAVLCGGAGPVADTRSVADEEQAVEVDIAKLTSIKYRRGKALPADIRKLDGKRIGAALHRRDDDRRPHRLPTWALHD